MDNNRVIVFRALDGTPTLYEGTKTPWEQIRDRKIYFSEDIDPHAGDGCRNQAYGFARVWLAKLKEGDLGTQSQKDDTRTLPAC